MRNSATGQEPELRFDVKADGPARVIIAIAGEVDMATAPEVVACLYAHADRDIVVDLSEVSFLDSSGIGALISGYNRLQEEGHTLRTVRERANVLKALEVTGTAWLLHGTDYSA